MEFQLSIIYLFFILITSVTPNPIPNPSALSPGACKVVDEIVDVLKLFQASSFCSTFLSLSPVTKTLTYTASPVVVVTAIQTQTEVPTVTSSVLETDTTVNTIIQTIVSTVDLTSTIVISTNTSTMLDTIITSTSTLIDIITTTDVILSTLSITPSPTTTIYTPLVRRDAQLKERAIFIPSFLKTFASSAISDACSCLSLPTVTNSAIVTVTSPVTTVIPAISTVTDPVKSDVTVIITSKTPVTIATTALTTSTATLDVETGIIVTSILNTVLITPVTSVQEYITTETLTQTAPGSAVTLAYPNQVVQNPSFEMSEIGLSPEYWTISDSGGWVGYVDDQCDDTSCAYDGSQYFYISSHSPGSITLSQTLAGIQVGKEYAFSAYIGYSYAGGIPVETATVFNVTLDGFTLLSEQAVCMDGCSLGGSTLFGYEQITATVTPTTAWPVLEIAMMTFATSPKIADTLLDEVTLTLI